MRWLMLVIFVSAAVGLFSCSDDPKKPEPEPVLQMQAGSWGEAISHFATAWETRNFELYDSLLTADYVFFFNAEDVEEDPDIPPTWNLAQELAAVSNMFVDPNIERITLDWNVGAIEDPIPFHLDGSVLVTDIDLEIDIRDPETGELWENVIHGAVWFGLRKMPYATADGDTVWKIAEWKDLTNVSPLMVPEGQTQEASWGRIKSIY
ncbi:MAG: hypothetical protein KJ970_04520 [Candidatus Eisenbacteria bacterium]|uniref:Uncharacterized protein n=1 Tax=Eiseniibacteriota bacterium TaxID=2212470 RepID=A0A948RSG9_UNCEI|nr:hypothetical protein [Candidatus Eisenbacteria bacterium]MBU1948161.1 hypothetical protein [Candidatus Eisenbacteria bacterium]MBU2690170.1 hypothetical protein [Candidatus Eisenbacteria bacterium]